LVHEWVCRARWHCGLANASEDRFPRPLQRRQPARLAPSGLSVRKEHEYEEWRFYPLVIPLAGMIDFKVVDLASGLEGHH
jgi:hypothetical protein